MQCFRISFKPYCSKIAKKVTVLATLQFRRDGAVQIDKWDGILDSAFYGHRALGKLGVDDVFTNFTKDGRWR